MERFLDKSSLKYIFNNNEYNEDACFPEPPPWEGLSFFNPIRIDFNFYVLLTQFWNNFSNFDLNKWILEFVLKALLYSLTT